MDQKLIKEASMGLDIKDIYLLSFNFEPHQEYHPSQYSKYKKLEIQEKKEIVLKKATLSNEDGEKEILIIEALLGIRSLDEDDIVFTIEAKFRSEYAIKDNEIPRESFEEFAKYNGIHAIWPFWRQFIYDMMPKLRLPIPEIPLRPPLFSTEND